MNFSGLSGHIGLCPQIERLGVRVIGHGAPNSGAQGFGPTEGTDVDVDRVSREKRIAVGDTCESRPHL